MFEEYFCSIEIDLAIFFVIVEGSGLKSTFVVLKFRDARKLYARFC